MILDSGLRYPCPCGEDHRPLETYGTQLVINKESLAASVFPSLGSLWFDPDGNWRKYREDVEKICDKAQLEFMKELCPYYGLTEEQVETAFAQERDGKAGDDAVSDSSILQNLQQEGV